jgi:hypothetical protein
MLTSEDTYGHSQRLSVSMNPADIYIILPEAGMPLYQIPPSTLHRYLPISHYLQLITVLLSHTSYHNQIYRIMSGVTSALKPLTLWSHWGAPNPYKVLMVLEILHLPYILHPLEFSEVKSPAHLGLNPNGRLPTLEDPNTGIVLWEVRVLL